MLDVVDFAVVRERVISHPKPPVRARLVERQDGTVIRTASVMYDGDDLWYVDDGHRIELNKTREVALLVDENALMRIAGNVAANSWAKSMLAGHLLVGLDAPPSPSAEAPRARGRVVAVESVNGYECWVADIEGLKADQDVTFRLWVEPNAGFVIRLMREDIGASVDAEDLVIGTRG